MTAVADGHFRATWNRYDGNYRLVAAHLHLGNQTVRAYADRLGLRAKREFSIREAARMIAKSSSQLHRLLVEGKIEARQGKGGRWHITRSALQDFLDGRKQSDPEWIPLKNAASRMPYDVSVSGLRIHCQKGWVQARKGNRGEWLVHRSACRP